MPDEVEVVYFDLGDTLGTPVLAANPTRLVAFDTFPFVPDLLEKISQKNVRLGIISNTGDEKANVIDPILARSGILRFFDPSLRLYSGEVGLKKDSIAIFQRAAQLAGLAKQPGRCLFVGEDGAERRFAVEAGMLVAPHPLLVPEVLDGQALRFVRITVPPGRKDEVFGALKDLSLVTVHLSGPEGTLVYAVTSQRVATNLINMRLAVDLLGEPGLPDACDLYLLRDDVAASSGFMSPTGETGRFFAGPDTSHLLLSSDPDGLIVALPNGRSPGDFHFAQARHGHTLRLLPDPMLLEPALGMAAAGFDNAIRDSVALLSADELGILATIEAEGLVEIVKRYSGERPLSPDNPQPVQSRHIAHFDNARVVTALASDLEAAGLGRLEVRLIQFSHRGLTLHNVEAELVGTAPGVVLITAHLDSTAANDGHYDEVHGPAPGADDDASGVAAVLRAAACFSTLASLGEEARRTIRFVLFNAEEEGLVGSRVYARQQRLREEPIVGVYQMDMIGFHEVMPRSWEVHFGFSQSSDVERRSAMLAATLAQASAIVSPKLQAPQLYRSNGTAEGDPAAGRSDHAPFHAQGYAACVVSEDFFLGPEPDSPQPQANPSYHSAADRSVDGEFAADIARAVAAATWLSARHLPLDVPLFTPMNGKLTRESPVPTREVDTSRSNWHRSLTIPVAANPFAKTGVGNIFSAGIMPNARFSLDPMAAAPVDPAAPFGPVGEAFPPGSPAGASLIDRAVSYARQMQSSATGFSAAADVSDFEPNPLTPRTSSGAATVHLQQTYRGIPVFRMSQSVRFEPQGMVIDAQGPTAFVGPNVDVEPTLPAPEAAFKAAQHLANSIPAAAEEDEFGQIFKPVALQTDGYVPTVIAAFPTLATQPTVVEWKPENADEAPAAGKPFENPIPLNLVIFDQEGAGTRLAWYGIYTFANYADQWFVIVSADAKAGEILAADSTMHHVAAEGLVYEFSPGVAKRTAVSMPRPLSDYPIMPGTPLGPFPADWVERTESGGNSTIATLNFTDQSLSGQMSDGKVTFSPRDPDGDEQKLLNIFYFCNYMHDFLYMLGFDETSGNFQKVNFTHTAGGGDPVRARAHSGPVNGTANMSTAADGLSPVMNMGLVPEAGGAEGRHTAFDADVVMHEYTHGLTNRLVGGTRQGHALDAPQSAGMGEGWSDFFALTIQNYFRAKNGQPEKVVTGDWVVDRPDGIRSAPYDDAYPDGYGQIPSFPRHPRTGLPDEHRTGEIWCAALMMMTRRLRQSLDDTAGYRLAWQMVVDGLKLTPANPSFVQARDAIFLALDHMRDEKKVPPAVYAAARRAAWTAFARFGLGAKASSEGAGIDSIVADTSLPSDI